MMVLPVTPYYRNILAILLYHDGVLCMQTLVDGIDKGASGVISGEKWE